MTRDKSQSADVPKKDQDGRGASEPSSSNGQPGNGQSGDPDEQLFNEDCDESTNEESMRQLKKLLVGSEQESLLELARRIDDERLSPDELSQLLPLAVRKAAKRGDQFANALGPTLANSFQDSVKRNPKALADAISPIMGPAIRRAISQAIRGMIQSLNQTVEHSFSWNGLKWRWQAFKTGRPFAEVVLLNAFIYRVEQIFLIHRDDGTLLALAHDAASSGTDADLVSGMLTAIQDFVRQSFGASDDDSIESMRVGDHHVWVLSSPHALLAAVIRGVPPIELRTQLRRELESIHEEMSAHFNEYEGDNTPFEMVIPRLEDCLQSETRHQTTAEPSLMKKMVPALMLLLPLLLLGTGIFWGAVRWREANRIKRIATALRVPETASLSYDHGVATLTGSASHEWIERARGQAAALRDLDRIELERLEDTDLPWLNYVNRLRKEPGIMVAEAQVHEGRYRVTGLRDPQAKDPQALLIELGVDPTQVDSRWESFESLEPRFVRRRLLDRAPQGVAVEWRIDGDRLVASGNASRSWFRQVDRFRSSVGTDAIVDTAAVVDGGQTDLEQAVQAVDGNDIDFKADSPQISETERGRLKNIARQIGDLQKMAQRLESPFDIIIVGYVDPRKDEQPSDTLARERADSVWKFLIGNGAEKQGLLVRNGGAHRLDRGDKDRSSCEIIVEKRE